MKITYFRQKETPLVSLEQFADAHNLEMAVHERPENILKALRIPRWYAHFKRVEVKERGMLVSTFGDGDTPEAAIKHYASEIAGKELVYQAGSAERREFRAPKTFTDLNLV